MRSRLLILLILVSLAPLASAQEEPERFGPPVRLEAGGKPIDVEDGHAAPYYADIDGSGKLSLLVGQFGDGKVRVYPNQGTPQAPKFTEYKWLEAGGRVATVPVGCCIGFTPQVVDLDGDGIPDVLSGSYPGELYFFKGQGQGKFAGPVKLEHTNGKSINAGSASTVFAADLNGDGKLDLLVGDIEGRLFFVPGAGKPGAPAFGDPQEIMSNGHPWMAPDGHSGPIAFDWDGDGKLDILVGCGDGTVVRMMNTGTKQRPVFGPPIAILHEGAELREIIDLKPKRGMRSKLCVADFNGDGKPDLLVGDYCPTPEVHEISEADRGKLLAARDVRNRVIPKLLDYWNALNALKTMPADSPERPAAEAKAKEMEAKVKPEIQALTAAKSDIARLSGNVRLSGHVWVFLAPGPDGKPATLEQPAVPEPKVEAAPKPEPAPKPAEKPGKESGEAPKLEPDATPTAVADAGTEAEPAPRAKQESTLKPEPAIKGPDLKPEQAINAPPPVPASFLDDPSVAHVAPKAPVVDSAIVPVAPKPGVGNDHPLVPVPAKTIPPGEAVPLPEPTPKE